MTARRRLTLDACALLFSIILAVVGPLASRHTGEKMAAFATDAATTTGAVIYKKSEITLVSYAPT